jgi:hypothetical protein
MNKTSAVQFRRREEQFRRNGWHAHITLWERKKRKLLRESFDLQKKFAGMFLIYGERLRKPGSIGLSWDSIPKPAYIYLRSGWVNGCLHVHILNFNQNKL